MNLESETQIGQSKLVDSDSRMVGQLTATLQGLLDALTRPHARGLADFNEDLCRRLWA